MEFWITVAICVAVYNIVDLLCDTYLKLKGKHKE